MASLPLDTIALLVLLISAVVGYAISLECTVAERSFDTDRCASCRYSLTGLTRDAPCPECGNAEPWKKRVQYIHYRTKPTPMLHAWIFSAAIPLAMVFMPLLWNNMWNPTLPSHLQMRFAKLNNEPTLGLAYAAATASIVWWIVLAVDRRRMWTYAFAGALGLIAGSLIGLRYAWIDRHNWHPHVIAPVAIASTAGAILGMCIAAFVARRRRFIARATPETTPTESSAAR